MKETESGWLDKKDWEAADEKQRWQWLKQAYIDTDERDEYAKNDWWELPLKVRDKLNKVIIGEEKIAKDMEKKVASRFLGGIQLDTMKDSRWNADAWIQIWMSELDLDSREVEKVKKMDIKDEDKVAKLQEYAKGLAEKSLSDLAEKARKLGIELEYGSIELDYRMDRINWYGLIEKEE